jgi:hypothetical protein
MASWRRALRILWIKRNSVFVGNGALSLLQAGGRLTEHVAAPHEFDLS